MVIAWLVDFFHYSEQNVFMVNERIVRPTIDRDDLQRRNDLQQFNDLLKTDTVPVIVYNVN